MEENRIYYVGIDHGNHLMKTSNQLVLNLSCLQNILKEQREFVELVIFYFGMKILEDM